MACDPEGGAIFTIDDGTSAISKCVVPTYRKELVKELIELGRTESFDHAASCGYQ